MTDLTAAFKARHDLVRQHMTAHYNEDRPDFGVDPLFNDAGELGGAVQAVLDLHAPEAHPLALNDVRCKGCATHVTFAQWPCATVQVMARALGLPSSSVDEGNTPDVQ